MPEYHSIVRYHVGGKDYPMYSDPRCFTCNSPLRAWIEEQIIYGYGWSVIASQIDDDKLNARNIAAHYTHGHLPLPLSAKRKLIEDRAKALKKDTTDMVGPIADPWSISQIGMQAAFEKLQNGEMDLDAKDLIAFVKLNVDIESRLNNSEAINEGHILQLLQAAKDNMTEEQWSAYLDQIEDNPALSAPKELPQPLLEERDFA